MIQNNYMNGRSLLSFAQMIIDAINNNQMPKLRSSWKYIQNQMNDKACEDAIELV